MDGLILKEWQESRRDHLKKNGFAQKRSALAGLPGNLLLLSPQHEAHAHSNVQVVATRLADLWFCMVLSRHTLRYG
ncbi:MAG: hypothetical protein JEY79_14570 [Pseudodesulfovibrio sp.]|nr:hypothetical protein [Pseudodesulfovibrio sp.]